MGVENCVVSLDANEERTSAVTLVAPAWDERSEHQDLSDDSVNCPRQQKMRGTSPFLNR